MRRREQRPGALTFDTGALVGLQRGDKRITDVVREAHRTGAALIVPANALAEWWRGGGRRQENVLANLKPFSIYDVNQGRGEARRPRA